MRSNSNCRAKDPSSCPHHGKGASSFVAKIKSALKKGDYNAYEEARSQMESSTTKPPAAPPTRTRIVSPEEAEYEMQNSNLSDADRAELAATLEVQRTGERVRKLR